MNSSPSSSSSSSSSSSPSSSDSDLDSLTADDSATRRMLVQAVVVVLVAVVVHRVVLSDRDVHWRVKLSHWATRPLTCFPGIFLTSPGAKHLFNMLFTRAAHDEPHDCVGVLHDDWAALRVRSVDAKLAHMRVRVYEPSGMRRRAHKDLALLIYFHGGGFTISSGRHREYDHVARQLAVSTPAVVVSVDYRLAPKHPFPASQDDAIMAVRELTDPDGWWADVGRDLLRESSVDLTRVAVAGDSAGAALAAVAAAHLPERVAVQVLVYPGFGFPESAQSEVDWDRSYVLTKDLKQHFVSCFLRGRSESLVELSRTDARMNPTANKALLADLPPTLVLLAERDGLRQQGYRYATALKEAGVAVRIIEYEGQVHTFWTRAYLPQQRAAVRDAVREVRSRVGIH